MSSDYPGPPPSVPPTGSARYPSTPGQGWQQPDPRWQQPDPRWQQPPTGQQWQQLPDQEPRLGDGWRSVPRALRPVVGLLLVNLALSLVLTIVTLCARHSIVDYQLDHRSITDPQQRATLRDSYTYSIVGRVVGNIVVSVVYVFLVRALVRGRRWAYRRVIVIGAIGIVGLLLLQVSPYPVWMRVEQLAQAVVLAGLLYFVLRPEVKAHFDPRLPGRNVRRFNR